MEKGYHKGQDLTMSESGLSLEELAGQPLELFAREGAKLLLMVGLEEEVGTRGAGVAVEETAVGGEAISSQ